MQANSINFYIPAEVTLICIWFILINQGPVVQSIVSLTSSFCDSITKYADLFLEQIREAFAYFFKKNISVFQISMFEI